MSAPNLSGSQDYSSSTYANRNRKTAPNQININTASLPQLKALPGIGDAYSQKIVTGRPYRSADELVSKKILPSNILNGIRSRIRV